MRSKWTEWKISYHLKYNYLRLIIHVSMLYLLIMQYQKQRTTLLYAPSLVSRLVCSSGWWSTAKFLRPGQDNNYISVQTGYNMELNKRLGLLKVNMFNIVKNVQQNQYKAFPLETFTSLEGSLMPDPWWCLSPIVLPFCLVLAVSTIITCKN